ncbi:lysoplasmalogenase [Streptomyces sp. NPDC058045]|uniref:lysoplasmalogenase n=1 Tax=Streptomyces sp. NPDC058045 TaxID=3346311 RepID=UPI0036F06E1E
MSHPPRTATADPAAPPAPPGSRGAQLLLAAFALAAITNLGSLLADLPLGHQLAKPLLMPLLAGYVLLSGGPRLLAAALLFGAGGDILLLFDAEPCFLAGMGSFALGHLCYLRLFLRGRRSTAADPSSRLRGLLLPAGYLLVLVAVVAVLWSGLPAALRGPVAGYSLLLTAMAWSATRFGPLAAAGGLLFLLSDTLIATGIADLPQLPAHDFCVMLTYIAAQYALTRGVLNHRRVPTG